MKALSLEIEDHGSLPVAKVGGDVDVVVASRVLDRLLGAVRNVDVGLVVDLSQATYIDSAGINALFEVAESLRARQLRVAFVVADSGFVDRVLKIVDIRSVAIVRRTLDEALASIGSSGDESAEPGDAEECGRASD
jgi:anti-anti-sigma factor